MIKTMKPFCITFAGPAGCSKTPVAQYLSCQLGLPVLSNDTVRTELKEDQMQYEFDQAEYERRVIARIKDLAARKQSFIYDASNDRHWQRFLSNFEPGSYDFGVISYDFSASFYNQLLVAKKYEQWLPVADVYQGQHDAFVDAFGDDIICSITDESFQNRLAIALAASRKFIDDRSAKIS